MPDPVMRKVWEVFDQASDVYGVEWPIEYRTGEAERLAKLRRYGVIAFSSLVYAHKAGMSEWLNEWCAQFARETPDCIQTATFFPEPSVAQYTRRAVDEGARLFKVHLQVGGFDPRDEMLTPVWKLLSDSQIPTVIHCGSGPLPGPFTGPGPIGEVLARFPELPLIVAHMGAPEYGDFLALSSRFANVQLDTTMAFTDFMDTLAPFPTESVPALLDAGLSGGVLFGSDFPNIPYPFADAVGALERLELGDDWLRAVLYETGAQLFTVTS